MACLIEKPTPYFAQENSLRTTNEEPVTGEVVLYQQDDGAPAIEVHLEGETVWLSQQQIADLFQSSRTNIVEHIGNIYDEGELDEAATCRKS